MSYSQWPGVYYHHASSDFEQPGICYQGSRHISSTPKGKNFCRWLVKVHHSLKQSGVITCAGHIVGWGQKRRVRWDEHCSHICRVISPPFSQLQDISVSSQNVFKLTFILNLDVDSQMTGTSPGIWNFWTGYDLGLPTWPVSLIQT